MIHFAGWAPERPIDVPGGPGKMRLVEGEIKATGTNFSGYELFLAGATLQIDGDAPVGRAGRGRGIFGIGAGAGAAAVYADATLAALASAGLRNS